MKQVIAQFMEDQTQIVKIHDGSLVIALPYRFTFKPWEPPTEGQIDYRKAFDDFAAKLATHIENSRSGH